MRLLRQIVMKKLEKFYENRDNKIHFFDDIFIAYGIALVYMNRNFNYPININIINNINYLWVKYNKKVLEDSLKKPGSILIVKDNYIKELSNIRNQLYEIIDTSDFNQVFNLFFDKTKVLYDDNKDNVVLNIDKVGRILISSDYFDSGE